MVKKYLIKEKCQTAFFVDIGPEIASMIPELQTKFDQYLNSHQALMGEASSWWTKRGLKNFKA